MQESPLYLASRPAARHGDATAIGQPESRYVDRIGMCMFAPSPFPAAADRPAGIAAKGVDPRYPLPEIVHRRRLDDLISPEEQPDRDRTGCLGARRVGAAARWPEPDAIGIAARGSCSDRRQDGIVDPTTIEHRATRGKIIAQPPYLVIGEPTRPVGEDQRRPGQVLRMTLGPVIERQCQRTEEHEGEQWKPKGCEPHEDNTNVTAMRFRSPRSAGSRVSAVRSWRWSTSRRWPAER